MEIHRRITLITAIFCLFCQACMWTDPSVPEDLVTGSKLPTVTTFTMDAVYKSRATVRFALDITGVSPLWQCVLFYGAGSEPGGEKEFSIDLTKEVLTKEILVELRQLLPNTTYYCRLFFENGEGRSYSQVIRFTTKSTTEGQAWEKYGDLPFINTWYSHVYVGTESVLLAGSSDEEDAIFEFSPTQNTWTRLAKINGHRKDTHIFYLDGSVYWGFSHVKGTVAHHTNLYRVDSDLENGRYMGPPLYGCDNHLNVFQYGNAIYHISCPALHDDFTTYVVAYDAARYKWDLKMEFPSHKWLNSSSVVAGDRVFILGGRNSINDDAVFSNRLWEYVPESDTWLIREDFPGGARYDMRGFAIGEKAYFGYGMERVDGELVRMNDLWVYDPAEDSWEVCSSFEALNKAEITHSFGYNGEGYIATSQQELWKYTPDKDK